jgi:hypothetical protein
MFSTSKLITVSIRKGYPNQLLVYSMDKQSSRMQEQFYFSESGKAGNSFHTGFFIFFWVLPGGAPPPTSLLGEV